MSAVPMLAQSPFQGTQWTNAVPWPIGKTSLTCTALMSAADAANPASQLSDLALEVSHDNGVTWQTLASSAGPGPAWQGGGTGTGGGPAGPPALQVQLGTAPTHARVRFAPVTLLSIGWDVPNFA